MALLILALLQRIFLMSSLMLLLVWLIFFMVLIKLLPILGTISGKTVKLMVLALICLGNRSEERFSRNAETDLVCRLLLEKKKKTDIGRQPVLDACRGRGHRGQRPAARHAPRRPHPHAAAVLARPHQRERSPDHLVRRRQHAADQHARRELLRARPPRRRRVLQGGRRQRVRLSPFR